MFDITELLKPGAAPGDMAIGVVRDAFYNTPEWKRLKANYPKAQVLFKWREGGTEVLETMTVAELQAAIEAGTVAVSIDDGSGGQLEDA